MNWCDEIKLLETAGEEKENRMKDNKKSTPTADIVMFRKQHDRLEFIEKCNTLWRVKNIDAVCNVR